MFKTGDRIRAIQMVGSRKIGDVGIVVGKSLSGDAPRVDWEGAWKGWITTAGTIELIKEEQTMEPIYKAVHLEEDGGYSSIFAGQEFGVNTGYQTLAYRVGELTDAGFPQTVRCWDTQARAVAHAKGDRNVIICVPTAVLEVYPVGGSAQEDDLGAGSLKVQAVYVVKEVWRQEPIEEWVDVTGECIVEMEWGYVSVYHEEICVLTLGGGFSALTIDDNYGVIVEPPENPGCGSFTILHRVIK